MTLSARIKKLEQNKPAVPFGGVIFCDYGEPVADAAARQGIDFDDFLMFIAVTFVGVDDIKADAANA
ncbi:MAG: hypothetical protein HOK14_06400 [Gammaproteobacteria bacterium]|jgi:hypothetical protein|nr:hypothetical protein [Gammaproteobacteria bacterium]